MENKIQSSEKKRIVEESSNHKEIEMKFLDKDSSRKYSDFMENLMKTNWRKESKRSLSRKKSSLKTLHQDNPSNRSPLLTTPPKTQDKKISQETFHDEQSEENGLIQMKKSPYKFSYKSTIIQIIVAWIVTISVLYLIKLANFPYFELILVVALTISIDPWRVSNLLILCAIPIIIVNFYLGLSVFTYPAIVICYYSVLAFNQIYKQKQLFVFLLVFTIVFGFIILPSIYRSLPSDRKLAYFYVFPLLIFILRTMVQYCYWLIGKTAVIFLQLPLFITGLEYGTILVQDISQIQFWYLLVFFTLQIINERTQFFLKILISITKGCSKTKKSQKIKEEELSILPAHSNGHSTIQSSHLFLLVYFYAGLGLFTSPYDSSLPILRYIQPWYKPILVWILSGVYEIMSIILQKNRKDIILFGFISNKWWRSILRGYMLALGMWAFYLGLGVAVLMLFIL